MDDFRHMMHSLMRECRQWLVRDLLKTTDDELPVINWKKIQDEESEKHNGIALSQTRGINLTRKSTCWQ